ncbi:hypothetical protein XENOCAPTIV_006242 [Xenoophorus captivus]|uniref:Uncharacterized protein n=1 Tax=Xenoophorus captivus TaxID=1517983 RepID=A0ABV0S5E9_9TELE
MESIKSSWQRELSHLENSGGQGLSSAAPSAHQNSENHLRFWYGIKFSAVLHNSHNQVLLFSAASRRHILPIDCKFLKAIEKSFRVNLTDNIVLNLVLMPQPFLMPPWATTHMGHFSHYHRL